MVKKCQEVSRTKALFIIAFQFFKIVQVSQLNFVSGSFKRPPRRAGSRSASMLYQLVEVATISKTYFTIYRNGTLAYNPFLSLRFFFLT